MTYLISEETLNNLEGNKQIIFVIEKNLNSLKKKVDENNISKNMAGRFLAGNEMLFDFIERIRTEMGITERIFHNERKDLENDGDYISFYEKIIEERSLIKECRELYHLLDVFIEENDNDKEPQNNQMRF